ncbi:MAG: peptidase M23 [Methylotenera sp. 24-45-7]|jgi:septal ring factor EnvC (AmiA/AmiB activator)|nr:MAG: peptidase M23 [Mehylophilales bacterium 35-46-6]OYZ41231.1 MAG: peptidase M23 [Methylotenera sp. 24-45-7]OZA09883.1 MAG: peptidase M23 [Methylotenera sp. 17-45-7]OZA53874.1 MAG: peptidase M23 [Methylophilales bacterium 39-45-7]HQS37025.1 peptidoglycan DD-metalloendopeptidase family protein [Methylotenera sp.]
MNQTRFIQPIVYLCVAWLGFTSLAHAEKKVEQPKRALNDVHERLESLKKELNESKEAHKDAADALKDSEKAISEANKKLYEIAKKQQANKETLSKLQQDSEKTNQALAQQQQLLSSQLYQQYMHGEQSYVQMILQSEQPSLIARDIHYFSYIAKARTETIRKMQANLDKLNKLNQETAAALQQVAELKQKQIEERRTLEQQKLAKSKVVKSLSKQIATQRSEIKKLKRDEKRLAQLVERLAQAALAKPRLSKKLSSKPNTDNESAGQNNQKVIASNQTLPSDEVTGINFSALKGKLRLPVRGDVTNRFGGNREDSGVSWKGLFIRASEGAEVKSVAGGRVVFADWLRGFGNLIIVDHGDGYMSLYGNNQSILKQAGDAVRGGDAIAYVGNSGGNASNGVYYELRRQSKPFDPLSWSNLN